VVWLQPCPANLATVTIDRTGTALAMASGPNYLAGSNKVTVVKQHGLEPRDSSFGNVPLFGAGCQHFEPNALHAVIDTAADHIRVCLAAHFPPVIVLPGQPCGTAPRRIRPADRRRRSLLAWQSRAPSDDPPGLGAGLEDDEPASLELA